MCPQHKKMKDREKTETERNVGVKEGEAERNEENKEGKAIIGKPGMVAYTSNPSAQETEAGGSL